MILQTKKYKRILTICSWPPQNSNLSGFLSSRNAATYGKEQYTIQVRITQVTSCYKGWRVDYDTVVDMTRLSHCVDVRYERMYVQVDEYEILITARSSVVEHYG